jgi:hypothetical protein
MVMSRWLQPGRNQYKSARAAPASPSGARAASGTPKRVYPNTRTRRSRLRLVGPHFQPGARPRLLDPLVHLRSVRLLQGLQLDVAGPSCGSKRRRRIEFRATRKRPAKAVRGRWFQAAFGRVRRDREARALRRMARGQDGRKHASRACLLLARVYKKGETRTRPCPGSLGASPSRLPPLRKKRQILRTRRPKYLRLQL